MNYNVITIEDCIAMYEDNKTAVINNGYLEGFIDEKED